MSNQKDEHIVDQENGNVIIKCPHCKKQIMIQDDNNLSILKW